MLAYAQQSAYLSKENVTVTNDQGEEVTIQGFVPIEQENVTIEFDNNQMHMMRYIPQKTVVSRTEFQMDPNTGEYILDDEGNPVPIVQVTKAQWAGFLRDTGKMHYINATDANQIVSSKFLEQVKRKSKSKSQVFVEIPPGANNIHRDFPRGVTQGPHIHYKQKIGERTCLVTAVASLLYFANSRQHASRLFAVKNNIQESIYTWRHLQTYLSDYSNMLKLKKVNYCQMDINKIDPEIPIITCLRASNGKEDHTVTIYNN